MEDFNHYNYCRSNPIKYTDPTGMFVLTAAAVCIIIVAFVAEHAAEIAIIAVACGMIGSLVKDAITTEKDRPKENSDTKKGESEKTSPKTEPSKDPKYPTPPPDKDKKEDIYYRGLSKQDVKDIEKSGAIKSNALRNGEDAQKIIGCQARD